MTMKPMPDMKDMSIQRLASTTVMEILAIMSTAKAPST
jgi:hypothetical protein